MLIKFLWSEYGNSNDEKMGCNEYFRDWGQVKKTHAIRIEGTHDNELMDTCYSAPSVIRVMVSYTMGDESMEKNGLNLRQRKRKTRLCNLKRAKT